MWREAEPGSWLGYLVAIQEISEYGFQRRRRTHKKPSDKIGCIRITAFRNSEVQLFDAFHDEVVGGSSKWVRAEEVEVKADTDGPYVGPACDEPPKF